MNDDSAEPTLLLLVDTVALDDEERFGLTDIRGMAAVDDGETASLVLLLLYGKPGLVVLVVL